RDAGVGDRAAYALLVAVDLRGVDVAVPGGEGLGGDIGGDIRLDLEHAVAELRDRVAVVEGDGRHVGVRCSHGTSSLRGPVQPTCAPRRSGERRGGIDRSVDAGSDIAP